MDQYDSSYKYLVTTDTSANRPSNLRDDTGSALQDDRDYLWE